jgi:hypothetical protein
MTKMLRTAGFLLVLSLFLVLSFFSCTEQKGEQQKVSEPVAKPSVPASDIHKQGGPSVDFLNLLKERGITLKILDEKTTVDLEKWPKDSAVGAEIKRLHGLDAGLPTASLPGAKFISQDEARRMDTTKQKTGLFMVDIDFVPRDIEAALKSFKFTLKEDGTLLDANEEPILAMVTSEVYLIRNEKKEKMSNLIVPEAYAASPFPWRCYSFTPWAVYHGGFHRWYDARTWAATYGADGAGGCSSGSPHTRVDYLYTRAAVGGWGDSDHCFNCETEYSRDTWDVGYFWPAHGIPVTTHHAVYADGTFSFSRTSHLTW